MGSDAPSNFSLTIGRLQRSWGDRNDLPIPACTKQLTSRLSHPTLANPKFVSSENHSKENDSFCRVHNGPPFFYVSINLPEIAMSEQFAFVTGASSGIGFSLAKGTGAAWV
jgi:hypothetical protein